MICIAVLDFSIWCYQIVKEWRGAATTLPHQQCDSGQVQLQGQPG